jgi:hypothetical protein
MRAILGIAICCFVASGQTARRAEVLLHDGMRQQRELEQRMAERQREQERASEQSMRRNRVRPLEPVPAAVPAPVENVVTVEQPRTEAPAASLPSPPLPERPQRWPVPFGLAAACLLACVSLYNLGKIARQRFFPH